MSNLSQNMRVWHRNLGFFLSGIMAIYALSGITLIFRDTDTFKKTIKHDKTISTNLAPEQLGKALKIRKLKVDKVEGQIYHFKGGTYDKANGKAKYTEKKVPFFLDKLQHLHKAKSSEPLFFLNIFFGLGLLFFVISSFWMFIPSSSIFKKGLWFVAGGILLAVILLLV